MMQAIRVHQYGEPDVLTLEAIAQPKPQTIHHKTRRGYACDSELAMAVLAGIVASILFLNDWNLD